MDNLIGEQYGNYRLTKKLGEGGFGYVYLAENIHTHHLVAIKLPNERIPSGAEEMFFEEARTISQFAHPHIARLLDFGVKDNTPYLVIEYAEQGSLRDRHPRGTRVDLTTVIAYVKQLTEALKYAHSRRITHRDIKPENFLMRSQDEILLTDFGIAIDSYTWRHTPQNAAGSVYYMAPEQLRGKAESASDQYSLAITVYEWLCGTVPFKGTRAEIESQHKNNLPPPLHSYISIIPSVEKVILKALAKEPEQRFGSIQEFAQALEQTYQEQINNLLEESALTLDLLQYEHVQHMLLDLVLTNPKWWNDSGCAKVVDLRIEAGNNLSLSIPLKEMLAALAAKAIERLITVSEHKDWEGCSNLLHLITEAVPPSTASVTWISLLEKLSSKPRVIEALRKNWQIHSLLLEQWGHASLPPENKSIDLWFSTTWPEFWPFVSLSLPEGWYDAALAHLLTTTANTMLPPDIVRSIEQAHHSILENYMRRAFSTYAYRSRTVLLFATLVKSGYAQKMKLLSILLHATDVPQEKRQDYIEAVLKEARLTVAEVVLVLEQQWPQLETSSHLTVVLDSISQYLLAFSVDDLSRPSAKKFLQLLHESPSLSLSKESLQLAESWYTISLFFERPTISKAQLRSLANAIRLLPASLHKSLIDKMNELFILSIDSEASLMCVTEAMSTFLTDPELLRFLHLLAEGAGNAYKQKRLETFLVPYILIAFQTETIIQTLSSAEQREFTAQFLSTLLYYADKRTYQKLTAIAQNWSTPLATKWREYVFKHSVKDTTGQIQNVRLPPPGNTGTTAGRMAVPEIKKHKDGVDGNSAPVSPATAIRKPLFSRKRVLLLIILALLIGGSSSGLTIIHVNQVADEHFRATATTIGAIATTTANDATATSIANDATATASAIASGPYPYGKGTLVLTDPLKTNSSGNGWDETAGSCTFTGGAYHVIDTTSEYFNECHEPAIFSNFAFEVQMTIIKGDIGGITFRDDGNGDEYVLDIGQDGSYELYICKGAGKPCESSLMNTYTQSINQGLNVTNLIAVVAQGSNITLYVNHQRVDSVTDTTYKAGIVSLIANDSGNSTEVVYRNARAWKF